MTAPHESPHPDRSPEASPTESSQTAPAPSAASPAPAGAQTRADSEWQRLSIRVVWVDLAQSIVSVLPGVIAIVVFDVPFSWNAMWPLIMIAVFGVTGGIGDMVRWAFTRFRVTAHEIERSTGVFVRRRRRVQRDRIRSVDTHAKLRHRIAGLRVVTIGAGQQSVTGESAFLLDSLTKQDAAALRARLLAVEAQPAADAGAAPEGASAPVESAESEEVFATFRPWWVVYNMFSIWAYLTAAGLLWGLFWLLSTIGVDLFRIASETAERFELDWRGIALVGLIGGGLFGALAMGTHFLTGYWRFQLSRVRSGGKSYLRTTRGLFSTREVSRDESRMRGLSIAEPLLWRWIGMADTNVITTGLSVWDTEQPTAILPRGPLSVARDVARKVLGTPSPMEAPLRRHPTAALRRRLWWGFLMGAIAVAVLAVPVATGAVPAWALWVACGVWPLALLAAVIAYRALGHTIAGEYLVTRSGLMTRSTSALRRDSVSTIAIRQSLLQKRLGLCTVSAMTAGGWSVYEAPDLADADGLAFAHQAAPGLLDDFLIPVEER